mmetsp:Transcript_26727/g.58603  ORF Transcript_26727/g.58603 Transcript_26727/m.58603 type:complete len:216 (+) Transcript_26727:62-709(+)
MPRAESRKRSGSCLGKAIHDESSQGTTSVGADECDIQSQTIHVVFQRRPGLFDDRYNHARNSRKLYRVAFPGTDFLSGQSSDSNSSSRSPQRVHTNDETRSKRRFEFRQRKITFRRDPCIDSDTGDTFACRRRIQEFSVFDIRTDVSTSRTTLSDPCQLHERQHDDAERAPFGHRHRGLHADAYLRKSRQTAASCFAGLGDCRFFRHCSGCHVCH